MTSPAASTSKAAAADPLPPGWTQHVGPQGQIYYWHKESKTSTYKRPSAITPIGSAGQAPAAAPAPLQQAQAAPSVAPAATAAAAAGPSNGTKKEKPKRKEAIPGADGWLKITTNLGNVFFTHPETRRSEWKVPEEIKAQVRAWEKSLQEPAHTTSDASGRSSQPPPKRLTREEEEELKRKEAERQEQEYREAVRRELQAQAEEEEARKKKRKAQTSAAEGEDDPDGDTSRNKRARTSDGEGADDEEVGERDADSEADEAEWQRKIAAEMAAEIGAPPPKATEGDLSKKKSDQDESAHQHPEAPIVPQAELSLSEASAIFQQMLTSLNGTPSEVDPMAPWDRELPKFVRHPQYLVLKKLRDREDAFNEWCKLRIRQKRAEKAAAGKAPAASNVGVASSSEPAPTSNGSSTQATGDKESARAAYFDLLRAEVKSTRTRWDDFRKQHKKSRVFLSFGRDDKEREKAFKAHLKDLGEEKKKQAMKADAEFVLLLEETLKDDATVVGARNAVLAAGADETRIEAAATDSWAKAKKQDGLDRDPRYDAVGSSSRRAELFKLWLQGKAPKLPGGDQTSQDPLTTSSSTPASHKKKDAEQALREREEQIKKERERVAQQNQRALASASRSDSVIQFRQLLIDVVKDPLTDFRREEAHLRQDPRFDAAGLSMQDKLQMFDVHLASLVEKRRKALHAAFERASDGLDTTAEQASSLIVDDPEVERLNLLSFVQAEAERRRGGRGCISIGDAIDAEFSQWQRTREQEARRAFNDMLKENTFVEFWGRLRKSKKEKAATDGKDAAPKGGLAGGDDDDEDLEKDVVDMVDNFDLDEVHAVLAGDVRYKAFKHVPEKREQWIKEHLDNMQAAKQTVHQKK